jgi:hypothetical protein
LQKCKTFAKGRVEGGEAEGRRLLADGYRLLAVQGKRRRISRKFMFMNLLLIGRTVASQKLTANGQQLPFNPFAFRLLP